MRRSMSQSQYFLEKVCCVINKWQFCTAKLAKSANYSSGASFRNIHLMKIMLVMRNYAKNYASTIYQDLLTLYLFDLENILSDFEGSLRFLHFGVGGGGGCRKRRPWSNSLIIEVLVIRKRRPWSNSLIIEVLVISYVSQVEIALSRYL